MQEKINPNFRLIAIRIGNNNQNSRYKSKTGQILDPVKILKSNTIYPFYTHFEYPDNNLNRIIYNSEKDINLYSISTNSINIPLNINAVVGSNGSGKSTLLDLLNWSNYNLGCKLGLLKGKENRNLSPFKFLDLEFVYSISKSSYYKFVFKGGNVLFQHSKLNGNTLLFGEKLKPISTTKELKDFFYTIVINYSHYALNSDEVGEWIIPLFHKNDGYQTPIVLNPKRIRGEINITKENHLLTRRLQANLLEYVEEGHELKSLRNLANGKISKHFKLKFRLPLDGSLEEPKNPVIAKKIIIALKVHFDLHCLDLDNNSNYFTNITFNYIYEKLGRMAKTYRPYKKYWNSDRQILRNINAFIRHIRESNSHIVFKVKGAILYLKYANEIFDGIQISQKKEITLEISKLSNLIRDIDRVEPYLVNTFMMSPPSFFQVDIIPDDKSLFSNLSSGEKQRIHSISSIVYHLINLNSVEEQKETTEESYVHYKFINIVLDEIELYYHPDWQRKYVAELIDYIGKINHKNFRFIKALNITFLTHSPFILSDIPTSNILFLDNFGNPRNNLNEVKTFGANIHDLLKHSFFLKDGSMGAFAVEKINDTINFLNYLILKKELSIRNTNSDDYEFKKIKLVELEKKIREFNLQKHKDLIEIIDEPILKNKLREMYEEASEESMQIELLEKRIFELKNELLIKKSKLKQC